MRIEGWERRLSDYLETCRNKSFEWGTHDCVLFAGDICLLLCGIDPAVAARGQYQSKEQAFELLKQHGLSQAGIMDAHFSRIKPFAAQRGDIVYRRSESGAAFGTVYNGRAVYLAQTKGCISESLTGADVAWRIEAF